MEHRERRELLMSRAIAIRVRGPDGLNRVAETVSQGCLMFLWKVTFG
jgi:hypothetical protein